ncbi:MAG TPA: arginine biosynthesis protein ArgJ [Spirochaetaceae bacterium]|nr:arginine biosynthesis protein ArgJ [Spirochaetaceae bacterium]
MIEKIEGGVCAAKGWTANGVHCGIRKSRTKRDLSLIFSDRIASCAAVYTTNLVKGAPLVVTQENIEDGMAQAVICNSGNANTCNADGIEVAKRMCRDLAAELKISEKNVVVASTGVIGQRLDANVISAGIAPLVAGLSSGGCDAASEGIMTTDVVKKEVAYKFEIEGVECRIGGIAKGSGMIAPNMATMLVFITTDADISPLMLKYALRRDIAGTFNMISIDGDTSTNDMVCVLANGAAGNATISAPGKDFEDFCEALNKVNTDLCKMIAGDGEGATKFIECVVEGAKNEKTAKTVAKSVISSDLFKAAMFGADANWGRVLCAIGYSGADVDVNKVGVSFRSAVGEIEVCRNGAGVEFSEEEAKRILSEKNIQVLIGLHSGEKRAVAWGCDLTYDYVKINGDYRT